MRAADAGLLVVGVMTLLSVTARAEVGTVFYKDGGRISGEIVEVRPNQFVVVHTATGETRRIDWSEVDHVSSQPTPPAPPALQAPPVPPPNIPPPEEGPTATIVLRSNAPSTLLQLVTGPTVGYAFGYWGPVTVVTGQSRPLCTAPCRAQLPLGPHELMVSAPGAPSAYARLNLHPGENFVVARMGSAAMVTGGYAAVSVGVVALLTGASLLFSYAFYPSTYYYYSYSSAYYAWGLAGVIGGALLTGGGVALVTLGASSVGPDPTPTAPRPTSGLPAARGLALALQF